MNVIFFQESNKLRKIDIPFLLNNIDYSKFLNILCFNFQNISRSQIFKSLDGKSNKTSTVFYNIATVSSENKIL